MKKRKDFYKSHPEVEKSDDELVKIEKELYADQNISVVLEFSPK